MLTRIRKSMEEKDRGFTLIELLVVMIIIGILAAIAIPVFLNQRKKAVDSSIKSDLRTIASEMETYYTDNQSYILPTQAAAADSPVVIGTTNVRISSGNTFAFKLLLDATTPTTTAASATGFCVTGKNAKASDTTNGFIYNSLTGGLKTGSTSVVCP
jgi:type IV pilus assembly protein PilA